MTLSPIPTTSTLRAVLTGDLVASELLSPFEKREVLDLLVTIFEDTQALSKVEYQLFRGDSFQCIVHSPEEALTIAVMIRSGLIRSTPKGYSECRDARIAIGIGKIDFVSDEVITSDGEAFRHSGRAFDNLTKSRLIISTGVEEIDAELAVSTLFADDLITGWTSTQAVAIYETEAYGKSQKKIAEELGQSPQNISKILQTAGEKKLRAYISRFRSLVHRLQGFEETQEP